MTFTPYLLLFAMASDGTTLLREVNRTGVRQKAIAVSSREFTEAYLDRLARTELAVKPHVNFIQLYIYGEKGGAPLPKPSHVTYDHWRGLYSSLDRQPNEIAEMVSVGGNAVLRIHDGVGGMYRHVVAGKDPLQVDVDGKRFEIIYFALSTPGPNILQRVDVYIRTDDALKTESGLELLRRLEPLFPDFEVSIFVRNDSWFIYEPTYPFVNPFAVNRQPPTPEEYNKGRTLRCTRSSVPCRLE